MRFPDRLNHHQHHLTVGRRQNNIMRGAGISASRGKFHRKYVDKIFMLHIFCRSQFWYLVFVVFITLKMFSLSHHFRISLNSYPKQSFSFDSFPAEAFAGRPRLQPHNNRRSGRTCFDSCSAPVLPFNCLVQYSLSMVSTSIHF